MLVHLLLTILAIAAAGDRGAFERGEELRARGLFREALLAYQEATLTQADPAAAHRNAAMIELALGDRELARIDYERYLALRPRASDVAQVRAVLAELERLTAGLPRLACRNGDALFDQGQIGQAAMAYETCINERPQDPTLWRRFARSLMRVGNRSRAIAAYRRYLELAPQASDAAFVRAILAGA